jgi:gamma-glutamyl-gamma-aminobutyrate hydrolase PuuD
MKPYIGITMNLEEQAERKLNLLDQDYARAVAQAGGFPVPLIGIDDSIPDLVNRLDGFLFTGGDDVHPRFYREKPLARSRIRLSPNLRTTFEIKLLKAALKKKKPVLAICYGTQLVNVALGGSLYQDILLQVPVPSSTVLQSWREVFHPATVFEAELCEILGGCAAIDYSSASGVPTIRASRTPAGVCGSLRCRRTASSKRWNRAGNSSWSRSSGIRKRRSTTAPRKNCSARLSTRQKND